VANEPLKSTAVISGLLASLNGSANVNTIDLTLTDERGRVVNLVAFLLDIQTSNGVVHVIDRVILPETEEGAD
jgi:uncharacterized membrane protein